MRHKSGIELLGVNKPQKSSVILIIYSKPYFRSKKMSKILQGIKLMDICSVDICVRQ